MSIFLHWGKGLRGAIGNRTVLSQAGRPVSVKIRQSARARRRTSFHVISGIRDRNKAISRAHGSLPFRSRKFKRKFVGQGMPHELWKRRHPCLPHAKSQLSED